MRATVVDALSRLAADLDRTSRHLDRFIAHLNREGLELHDAEGVE